MTQQLENKSISMEEIMEFLRSQAASMPLSTTSARYLRALSSLQSSVSVGTHGPSFRQHSDKCTADLSSGEIHTASANTNYNSSLIIDNLSLVLTDWLVNQWLMNTPFTTASLYLDIISSLWGSAVKDGQLPKTGIFSELKARLKTLGQRGWQGGIDDEIFARALRLTKNAACLIADDAVAADIVLWSLTHALQPLEDIALLKREAGLSQEKPQQRGLSSDAPLAAQKTEDSLKAVIFNNLSLKNARRHYLFPLRQSERTPQQLKKHIAKIVNALFRRARLPQATDPYQTVEALWAYAALSIGIPASALVSYLDYLHPGQAPLGLPVLKLSVVSCKSSENAQAANTSYCGTAADTARSADTSYCGTAADTARSADTSYCGTAADTSYCGTAADTFEGNFAQVGKIFLENPPRWYALSLRPGVRFTQLCRRLELLGDRVPQPQLFYPCEEIARAIGKKIVVRERPFIRSVVFFQAKLTDIGRLFARIGDLAWCYRQSARPGAPYADISERQFRLFQQTIARFTPDYEVAPAGELELRPNDRVQILGGLFAGREANFDSVDKAEEGVVYRLNIVGDNGFDWRVSIDKRLTSAKINH